MTHPVSRRTMLQTSGSLAAAAALGTASTGLLRAADADQPAPAHTIHETKVISRQPDKYCGWPTLSRRKNGELIVVWSGGRESHVCPFGRVEMMRSHDDGQSWTYPRVLLDGAIDDRDAGALETAKGSLLVTTFTSLAYVPGLEKAIAAEGKAGTWDPARLDRWQAAHNRISAEARQAELGTWMIRSTDGGITWSARYDCLVNSPHGPVQLSDGRVLYPGKQLWEKNPRVGVAVSEDDGETWQWLAEIPAREGDDPNNYHELHGVEAADGRLVVH
ncbi:MAG: exo-alpha-sialidase, partial [Planctomycetaceae bacterium]|nr:exo-alpha-sialidase [Planctomycetaceae bacterium]